MNADVGTNAGSNHIWHSPLADASPPSPPSCAPCGLWRGQAPAPAAGCCQMAPAVSAQTAAAGAASACCGTRVGCMFQCEGTRDGGTTARTACSALPSKDAGPIAIAPRHAHYPVGSAPLELSPLSSPGLPAEHGPKPAASWAAVQPGVPTACAAGTPPSPSPHLPSMGLQQGWKRRMQGSKGYQMG